jgi:hypothetical protein
MIVYAAVGFVAGMCPSTAAKPASHQHHHGKISHTLGCAWACHGTANHGAVDLTSRWFAVWLLLACLFFIGLPIRTVPLATIAARAPPFLSQPSASQR